MLLTLCFVKLLLFWIQVWPCQKDSRINSRYFKFGGNIRCFASKALEFLRALILRSVTQQPESPVLKEILETQTETDTYSAKFLKT